MIFANFPCFNMFPITLKSIFLTFSLRCMFVGFDIELINLIAVEIYYDKNKYYMF